MDQKELMFLMKPEEVHVYLSQRRLQLVGPRMVDLAEALDVKPQQASAMVNGTAPIGRKMIARLNEIDRDYELVQLVGVVKRKNSSKDAALSL